MTTEVAVMNRSAVALAADSAVTLTGRAEKVFNSGEKIYELSYNNPIGFMINNSLEFCGVPFEILVREFRSSPFCKDVATVDELANLFFDFLPAAYTFDPVSTYQTALLDLVAHGSEVMRRAQARWIEGFQEGPEQQTLPEIVREELADARRVAELVQANAALRDLDPETLAHEYAEVFDIALKQILPPYMQQEYSEEWSEYFVSILLRHIPSEYMSGLVFAGYGSGELWPALHAWELDGVVAGRIKARRTKRINISKSLRAEIVPFAQEDMVARFLDGIDPDISELLSNELHQSFAKLVESSLDALGAEAAAVVAEALKEVADHFRGTALPAHRKRNRDEVRSVVELMPKQEMIELAEALVSITSLKRRMSPGQESVGGPTDLAIISRSEGFVWVKRKHYFTAELNPRFFTRFKSKPA